MSWQLNLDGFALPIKQLKGTESVDKLNFSGKRLGVASAIVIAKCIEVNGALTDLNLAAKDLCGLDRWGDGTYTAEGINAIADALRVNGALTSLDLRLNSLGDASKVLLRDAVKRKSGFKLQVY